MKNITTLLTVIAAFSFVFAVFVNADDVTVSNPTGPPAGIVAVSQTNYAGVSPGQIQARFRANNSSDWRSITQTFQWPSNLWLDGIQLRLGSLQNSASAWSADDTQQYSLVIQTLAAGNVPSSTVAQLFFNLTGDKVAPDTWVYLDIDSNLKLDKDQWYGFELCPSGLPSQDLRTYWNTADNSDFPGRGGQANPLSSGLPRTTAYSSAGTDFTMYLTGVPEPATIVLLCFSLIGLLTRKK